MKISHKVRVLDCSSDRICIIEVSNCINNRNIYIIGVYLPQSGCKITSFDHHLQILNTHINRLKGKGYVVVIGDTNCHFGEQTGDRFWGSTSVNARKLHNIICAHNMLILDGSMLSSGPSYTFHVEGIGTTYLDHCIISSDLLPQTMKCSVLDEHFMNNSDHLPITVCFKCDIPKLTHPENNYHIKWNKIPAQEIEEKYTLPLQSYINQHMIQLVNGSLIDDPARIESTIDSLVNSMLTFSKSLSKVKKKAAEKPYWCKYLTKIGKKVKALLAEWKYQGRPRGENTIFAEYTVSKKSSKKKGAE